jgi:hypothetical protein
LNEVCGWGAHIQPEARATRQPFGSKEEYFNAVFVVTGFIEEVGIAHEKS